MPQIRSILVPVDFSDSSQLALDKAVVLAREVGASVDLLHVWEVPPFVPPGVMVSGLGPSEQSLIDLVRSRAEHELSKFVKDAEARGAVIRKTRTEPGDPARTIVEIATQEGYDLVVLGTHGRSGLSRLLLGSVAERAVRHATCPVLTVRTLTPSH